MALVEQKLPLAERFVHGLVHFSLRYRWFSLTWLLGLTAFFGYHAFYVQMYSQFADLLPQAHPYIKAYNHFRQTFGGANIGGLYYMTFIYDQLFNN